MPRGKRIDYPGAWHHVMNRGARRAPIFRLKEDCQGFLEFLGETVAQFELELPDPAASSDGISMQYTDPSRDKGSETVDQTPGESL